MKRTLATLAALLFILTCSITAFATEFQKLTLTKPVEVNGTMLLAGNYTLRFETTAASTTVSFLLGNKEMATSPAQLRTLTEKPRATQIQTNTAGKSPRLADVTFRGTTIGLSFDTPAAHGE
jgi:hypothetical protein